MPAGSGVDSRALARPQPKELIIFGEAFSRLTDDTISSQFIAWCLPPEGIVQRATPRRPGPIGHPGMQSSGTAHLTRG